MPVNSPFNEKPAILGGTPCLPAGPPAWPFPSTATSEVLLEAQRTGLWGKYHGPWTEELQQRLAELHQKDEAVLCSSGTVAIELALRGLNVGPGDEVILAAYDFEGNFKNILTVDATPMLVDVDRSNGTLDLTLLEQAITPATRCILVSHLHGGLVSMKALTALAQEHGIPVIEDACQVPGAIVEGRIAGSWGDIGTLSFGGSKLLTAGRGGALLTSSPQIAQRIRLYSFRGNDAYPLSELQAGLLIPQLEQLPAQNQLRQENVGHLIQALGRDSGLTPFENHGLTTQHPSLPGYYKLGLWYHPEQFDNLSRDLFCLALQAEGVALYPGFRALHAIHSRRRYLQVNELSVASDCDQRLVVLHHPVLLSEADTMQTIARAVQKIRTHAEEIRQQATADIQQAVRKKNSDHSFE
ncbi:DegT/DnrJ/EryC1/StrS family aminotransferase [Gimesia panareensis]|uniref:L-glutamine:2-deoxy-scyllo-inosose aminotransferase n=1 Tax=Gimesia panareensis TaxID=2527978 RepID=A0A517Q179_9PLAN|nr:aminotransferase class V-fold PLP-dependent enzyme [Gimesia panareensis]QDT25387.1 L-glutamine:2-deoxy-scyllo-inosose aminotransferase [Gimesia panareensis]QDU48347.1 L-glutamine:2-deoxy-scyllo-inosose aminotransferase [Gimesia panareensis]